MYTVSVAYIYDGFSDANEPILRKLKEYCEFMKIDCVNEVYDSELRSEDREYIERLPAIHIYVNNEHEKTVYPDTHPIQNIQKLYDTCQLKHLEYMAKQQIWNERIKYVKSIFKSKKRILEAQSTEYN